MEINVEEEKGLVRLVLSGRLDGASSPAFEKTGLPLVVSGKTLVLDCTTLQFISSAGLRSILMLAKKAKASAVPPFSISGLSGAVRESFLYSGFGSLLTIND